MKNHGDFQMSLPVVASLVVLLRYSDKRFPRTDGRNQKPNPKKKKKALLKNECCIDIP